MHLNTYTPFLYKTNSVLRAQYFLKFELFHPSKFHKCMFSNFEISNPPLDHKYLDGLCGEYVIPLCKKDTATEELSTDNIVS